jgi:hypothetical protein
MAVTASFIALACGKDRPRYELMIVSPINQARISSGLRGSNKTAVSVGAVVSVENA